MRYYLSIEGNQECSFDVTTAKKRYNKKRVKGAVNPPRNPKRRPTVVASPSPIIPPIINTPIFDPTEIFWTVENQTTFPFFFDLKETFVMKNDVFNLELDQPVGLHYSIDMTENVYIPPEMKKKAHGMEKWEPSTSKVKLVLNLKNIGDCSNDVVVLYRIYFNRYNNQASRIVKVAKATADENVLEYSETKRQGRQYLYQLVHVENEEESLEFSDDMNHQIDLLVNSKSSLQQKNING